MLTLVNGERDVTMAQQCGNGYLHRIVICGQLVIIPLGVTANTAVTGRICHQQRHGPITLGLDNDLAIKFHGGSHSGGQTNNLAQVVANNIRIGVGRQDLVNHTMQPD